MAIPWCGGSTASARGATAVAIDGDSGQALLFGFTARTPKGLYDCGADSTLQGQETILASVLSAAADSFALDACPPTADCLRPILSTYAVRAAGFAGFSRMLPKDGFVRVRLEVRRSGTTCSQRLMIESMRQWLGAPNPAGSGDGLYFAGSTGFDRAWAEGPFALEVCPSGAAGVIAFTAPQRRRLLAQPTGTSRWNGNPPWLLRNLGAHQCGRQTRWSYWVAVGSGAG